MHTQSLKPYHANYHSLVTRDTQERVDAPTDSGLISELMYSENQPAVTQLLLPLLQQLGKQSRWLLWLAPQQRLSRSWLQQSGLPISKVVQVRQISPLSTIDAMEKALLTGNYSVVLGWLPELSENDRSRLRLAAKLGNAYGFVMHPVDDTKSTQGQCATLKIHSSLYH
ncbi:SOS cell division inhibitor [Yersinia frederiksenii]|uniref:Cell division inhibitor SulA n=2 Tax=Yersinia frederiksenii TaxID=29484 RepID=A0A380PR53_YERFR|nr:SOS-induced cell division inhibitor SulA [Yersinia frederiksenii]ATM95322.1 cell division inhibitor SulA [Yersinia frederiksenii]EEQ14264.1 Cell division inhibitor sulA [Yersinia frederiksenii ATCC 33641]KGA47770.1 cell division inhibitor sulA [Yersinia frederiksenii ATCC 33641]CNB60854.1 SOS cell division inhibitor [Yersinia frederiksenii]SUP76104.1 SOS cell division inhibitor [Yersinia frederiksenii]